MARITRAQWGAGSHRSRRITNPARITRSFLHHTVTPQWVGKQAARNLQRIARERGFLDISYNEIIDRLGNEIEGRGFGG